MSKIYSNSDKVERIKEPLFQINRLKFRGPRNSELENVETNLLKLDLTRIENELDTIDQLVLDDISLVIGDIEDINTSILLDDGLSYEISDVAAYIDTAPKVFSEAVLWLDPKNSVEGETTFVNQGSAKSLLNAAYNGSPKLLSHTGENYLYNSGIAGNYAVLPPTPEMDLLGTEGTKFLNLPGIAGNYASTPDSAALEIAGDIEIVCRVSLTDWTPAIENVLVSRWNTPDNQRCFIMRISTSGVPYLTWSADGTTGLFAIPSGGPAFVDGITYWLKATLDVDNGAAGRTVRYFYASDSDTEPTSWKQWGSDVTAAGVTSLYTSSSAALELGSYNNGASLLLSGDMYRCIIRDGIGGSTVFDADFTTQSIGATSFTESTGKTVTVNGSATKIVDGTTYLFSSGLVSSFAHIADPNTVPSHLNILGTEGTKFLSLPGVTGNYASTPDSATLDITGDIEIVVRVALDNWTPTTEQGLVSKWLSTTNQRGYAFSITSTGQPIFYWSDLGTVTSSGGGSTSVTTTGVTDGSALWLKVTFDVDNGAGGRDLKFWWAPDQVPEPSSWTQLGTTTTTAGVTSIFANTEPLCIGQGQTSGISRAAGKFYRAIVRNGIGGSTVFDADFTTRSIGATSFTESTGKTVTVNGSAAKIVDGTTYLYNDGTSIATTATQATVGATTIVVASATGLIVGQEVISSGFITKGTLITGISGTTITISSGTLAAMSSTAVSFRYNNYASVPDNAALNFTGDLELVCRIAPRSWTPSSPFTIMSKGYGNGYYLYLSATNIGAGLYIQSATPTSISPNIIWTTGRPTIGGTAMWIKYTRNATTGVNTFFYCADQEIEPTAAQWVTIGTATESTAGTMIASNALFSMGAANNGSNAIYENMSGRFMRAIVRNGINGTKVLDVDFTRQIQFATSFVESSTTALTVTINGIGARIERERNLDITARLQFNSFTTQQSFVSKDGGAGTGGYQFGISTNGLLFLRISDGPTIYTYFANSGFSLSAIGLILGKKYWVRVTLDVLDSSVGSVIKFYFAEDQSYEPTTWIQIGLDVPGVGTVSIAPNNRNLAIGSYTTGGADAFNGKIYYASVKNGIGGTPVVKVDFTKQIQFATWFNDSSSYLNPVTIITLEPTLALCHSATRIERKRDLEIVCRVAADDWSPATESYIVGRYNTHTTGPYAYQRIFALSMGTTGRVTIRISPDGGATPIAVSSSVIPNLINGTTYWIKVTVDTDNGLAGNISRFFYAKDQVDEPTSWIEIGGPVITANATSFVPADSFLEIGTTYSARNAINTGTGPFAGKIFRVIIRNGIGGNSVADVDFTKEIVESGQNYLNLSPALKSSIKGALYIQNLGTGGNILNARPGATFGPDNTNAITATATSVTDPVWLAHTGENYLYLPGSGLNYASVADNAAFDILGDIDIACRVAINDWTPRIASLGNDLVFRDNGDPNRCFRFWVDPYGRPSFTYYPTGSAASIITKTCTVATGFVDGAPYWLRVTLDVDNGSGGNDLTFWWAPDSSSEPTVWYQLGAKITSTGVTSFANVTSGISIGGTSSAAAGKFYRTIVKNGISGTKVLDIDFTTAISAVNQTTLTDSTGKTVTIVRTTTAGSGKRAVAVYRSCWLFGANSYMEIADNGFLDFKSNQSISVVAVVRQWGTPSTYGRYICKGGGGVNQGWSLSNNNTAVAPGFFIGDGTNAASQGSTAITSGTFSVFGGILDRSNNTIKTFTGNTISSTVSTTSIGNLSNPNPVRIGAFGGSSIGNYQDFEFFAGLIFRKALTTSEVALINSHYSGTITDASTALLKQAVFYIDAANATQAGAIVRSTNSRRTVAVIRPTLVLGTSDYLRISDHNLLDFAAGESFSMMISFQAWNTPVNFGRLFSKSDNFTTSGYELYVNTTDDIVAFGTKGDTGSTNYLTPLGAFGTNKWSGEKTFGRLMNILIIRDTTKDTFSSYVDSTLSDSTTDTTTGTLSNAYDLVINGRSDSPGGSGLNFEFYGMAIWRKALSSDEIAEISDYYNLKSTILRVDTMDKLSGKLARILKNIQRLETGV